MKTLYKIIEEKLTKIVKDINKDPKELDKIEEEINGITNRNVQEV